MPAYFEHGISTISSVCQFHRQALYGSALDKALTEAVEVEDNIIGLTAQIVSAHVANNHVGTQQLPEFIRGVHQALATAGKIAVEPIRSEPAVTVKKSVFADHIVCLDCGKSFKMIKRHLSTDHQMTPVEYRVKWDLPPSYSMVAANYAATRSQLARDSGLGRKVGSPPPQMKRGRPKRG
jgi:predicted transcriptional regulator